MTSIDFSKNIRTHVDVGRMEIPAGGTIKTALDQVFAEHSRLRSYLLDDRGSVRKHVAVFRNGESILDRENLSDQVNDGDEIFVMQALSGG